MNKCVLIWSPNYAPDLTGIPPLVTSVAEWLVDQDVNVHVVTTAPHYPERRVARAYRRRIVTKEHRGRVQLSRTWVHVRHNENVLDKLAYEASIAALGFPIVRRLARHADAILCVMPSLLAAAAVGFVGKPRPRTVLWVQDLVTIAARAVPGPFAQIVAAGSARLEQEAVRKADRFIVCSEGFREYLSARGASASKISYIPNWVDLHRIPYVAPVNQSTCAFLYAGNLGYTQDFRTLVAATARLPEEVTLAVVGNGNAKDAVERLVAGVPNASLRPPAEDSAYSALLSSHDVHVLAQRNAAAGANLPSKLASSLASGRPVIAAVAKGSAAALLVEASGGGIVVRPESVDALTAAMRELAGSPTTRLEMGRRGRAYAAAHLSSEQALPAIGRALAVTE